MSIPALHLPEGNERIFFGTLDGSTARALVLAYTVQRLANIAARSGFIAIFLDGAGSGEGDLRRRGGDSRRPFLGGGRRSSGVGDRES